MEERRRKNGTILLTIRLSKIKQPRPPPTYREHEHPCKIYFFERGVTRCHASISISRCHEPHTWRLLGLRPRALNSFVSLNWIDPVPPSLRWSLLVSRCICNFASIKEKGGKNLEFPADAWLCLVDTLLRCWSINEPSSPDERIILERKGVPTPFRENRSKCYRFHSAVVLRGGSVEQS